MGMGLGGRGARGRFCRGPFPSSLPPPHLPQAVWATPLPGRFLSALHTVSHLILTTTPEAGPVTLRLLAKRKPRRRKAEEPRRGHAVIIHTEPPGSRSSIPNHRPALPHGHTHALSSLRPGTAACASVRPAPRVRCPARHGTWGVSKGLGWA